MRNKLLYWIPTALISIGFLGSGLANLAGAEPIVKSLSSLGYPLYLTGLLGSLKVIGVIALLVPKMRTLKEWAYAGFVFDMIGAGYSHIANGDPVGNVVPVVVLLALVVTSRIFLAARLGDAKHFNSAPIG